LQVGQYIDTLLAQDLQQISYVMGEWGSEAALRSRLATRSMA
jgi:hypothetical protein